MATSAPRRGELEVGAATAVKLTPVHECPEAQASAWVHGILQLVARAPVAPRLDHDAAEDIERGAGRVHQAGAIDFEGIAILPGAPEDSAPEPRRLPI